jgi:hypothetical protein
MRLMSVMADVLCYWTGSTRELRFGSNSSADTGTASGVRGESARSRRSSIAISSSQDTLRRAADQERAVARDAPRAMNGLSSRVKLACEFA